MTSEGQRQGKIAVFPPQPISVLVSVVYMLVYVVNSVCCGFHYIDSEVDQEKKAI